MNIKPVVGSRVSWMCRPHWGNQFQCVGTVQKIKMVVFGAKKKKKGAVIKVETKLYRKVMRRRLTTVGVDKLTVI